ncbi:MAG TPA: DUF4956 domain-containing protein [Gemmatimonadaceae bacterium]|nr:DUF4956 domain-containing protein [Gemmatimonadaceae bacterium]
MASISNLIDVVTIGSERPLRRLLAYYLIIGLVVFGLAWLFPRTAMLVAGKGLREVAATPQILEDGLTGSGVGVLPGFGPNSFGELVLTTTLILLGTLALMMPVTWVYMSARSVPGHNQGVVQTLIILPLVVAGIIIVVQNSLALAFSLAGVVGAVRFRTNLRDTRDLVFIFLSIAVGFAAGVQSLAVGALVSIVFNLVLLLTWRYDYGRNVLTPSAASQWAAPLEALAHAPGEDGTVPDRDLVLALSPDKADVLAERFDRVRKTLGKKKKKPKFNAVLTLTTDNLPETQSAVEPVLNQTTKRWKLDEVVTNTGKPSEIYYLVRPKKAVTRDELLTQIHDRAGNFIEFVNLEVADQDGNKGNGKGD